MSILKDIAELIEAGVITRDVGDRIQEFYKNKGESSTSRLFIVFGILGAILVGLGIILIIAHNWDELSRTTKTILAFLPLVIGQALCGFVLIKKLDSITWRESAAVFLFFSIGACISLVSQIYNISGNLSSFLLTWMLLGLPLIYMMRSSAASLLYLIGITAYAGETGYWAYPSSSSFLYWILLLLAMPHYYLLYLKKPKSNFMLFHNWIIPLSVVFALGTLADDNSRLMYIAYFSLFGLLYLIGELDFFSQQKLRNNGYKVIGSLGTVGLLLALSFDWFWQELEMDVYPFNEVISTPEFWASAILSLLAAGLLYLNQKSKALHEIKPVSVVFLFFIITFLVGQTLDIGALLINVYVFVIGILTIREGAKQNHLGILNYGLMVITALVICRFFDTDLSFVFRGVLFMLVGAGFFVVNYWMLKKRKSNA